MEIAPVAMAKLVLWRSVGGAREKEERREKETHEREVARARRLECENDRRP